MLQYILNFLNISFHLCRFPHVANHVLLLWQILRVYIVLHSQDQDQDKVNWFLSMVKQVEATFATWRHLMSLNQDLRFWLPSFFDFFFFTISGWIAEWRAVTAQEGCEFDSSPVPSLQVLPESVCIHVHLAAMKCLCLVNMCIMSMHLALVQGVTLSLPQGSRKRLHGHLKMDGWGRGAGIKSKPHWSHPKGICLILDLTHPLREL